jgi:hypothetical protein
MDTVIKNVQRKKQSYISVLTFQSGWLNELGCWIT